MTSYFTATHMHIDTEQLISEVKVRPALWDCSHDSYKDRTAKLKAWREVFHCIYPKYDDLSEIQKMSIERNIQQRWKTARDAYIRSKNLLNRKPEQGPIKRTAYAFSKHLKFLDKRHVPGCCGAADEADKSTDEDNQKQYGPSTSRIDTPPQLQAPQNNLTCREHSLKSTMTCFSHRTITNSQRKRKRLINNDKEKGPFDKSMMNFFKESSKIMQNDDMAFFYSLLPITQTFDNYQKMLFRSEVLKKAMEVSEYTVSKSNTSPMFVSTNCSPASGFDTASPEIQDEIFNSNQEPLCQVIEFTDSKEGILKVENTSTNLSM